MTRNEALSNLARVVDYLSVMLDMKDGHIDREIEALIIDIEAVEAGLKEGLFDPSLGGRLKLDPAA